MIAQVAKTSLISLGAGFLCQVAQDWLGSSYFTEFLKQNLINLLIALLAVNSATMGIVLTKIRELVEKHGHGDAFTNTRDQFLLAVKEQIVLVGASVVLFTVGSSKYVPSFPDGRLLLGAVAAGIFVYAMSILYDTAKGVLIIIDFKA